MRLLLVGVVAIVLFGSGAESTQGEEQLGWEPPCEINPWIAPPPYPPEDGNEWCWREYPATV
jgi:hypothetical protein